MALPQFSFIMNKNTMKATTLMLAMSLSLGSLHAQPAADTTARYQPTPENLQARQTFADSKFGIFLHWGIYSLFAQGEWYLTNQNLDRAEYAKAADAFYPHRFDAKAWVSAFKAAGARYICFTTRHHDGFSMWNTQQSDYNIMHTPYGRDILKQLADECHRQGLRLHLYYSHIDWTRDDYPAGRTGRGTGKDPQKADWPHYYDFMNRQLTELLTQYGEIGAVWFDGWWDHDSDAKPFDWQLPAQYRLIHTLQPACLIGNNHHRQPVEGEDIQLFERDVPGENKAGLSGQQVSTLPLETCQTMNGMWGYKVADQHYKQPAELIRLLVRTAAKGANLLLNIGPQPNGELPAIALHRLQHMGQWLGRHGEAIYATQAGPVAQGDTLVSTRRGDTLFLHLLTDRLPATLSVPLPRKPRRLTHFPTQSPLPFKRKGSNLTIDLSHVQRTDSVDCIIQVEM